MNGWRRIGARRWFPHALVVALAVGLGACQSYRIDPPAGFVVFDLESDFHAVSATGVQIRAWQALNEPEGDVSLWGEALRRSLITRGYRVQGEEDITRAADGTKGKLLRALYDATSGTHSYWAAFYVDGQTVTVIEAAALSALFQPHEASIRQSMQSTRLR